MIYGSLDESCSVVSLEAADDALVFWLDMRSKVRLKVFDMDVSKVGRNDMTRKVILQEKYFSVLFLEFSIPLLNPILIEMGGHPRLCIISLIEPQLHTHFFLECSRPRHFPNDKRGKLLRPTGIRCESVC